MEGSVRRMYRSEFQPGLHRRHLQMFETTGVERPVARSMKLTMDEFKDHYQNVLKDRYEERQGVIERAVRGAVDSRYDNRVKEPNVCLNVVPEFAEIREAMKETRESAPGLDGVRIRYIRKACEGIQCRLIEIVQ